jgi:hypothetical protein
MNTLVKPPSSGKRWGGLFLALLVPPLSTGVSQPGAQNEAPPYSGERSRSYLSVVGPPPLRFQDSEVAPQSDLSTRPPAGAPPLPPEKRAGAASRQDVLLNAGGPDPAKKPPKVDLEAAPPKPGPAAILPDDGDSRVRPEDFLPFFQFPGGRPGQADTSVTQPPTAPAPGQIPPSSATYHEG